MLALTEPTDADLAPLAAWLAREVARPSWKHRLIGDRAAFHEFFVCLRDGRQPGSAFLKPAAVFDWRDRVRDEFADRFGVEFRPAWTELLPAHTEAIAIADEPLPDQTARITALQARLARVARGTSMEDWHAATLARNFDYHRRWLTRMHCARVALAVERERLRTGAYPAAVADLPLSPFTGRPLVYTLTPTGATASDPAAPDLPTEAPPALFRLYVPKHRRQLAPAVVTPPARP